MLADTSVVCVCAGITEEEEESGGCDEDDVTSLVNGYRHGIVNGKSVIGGMALTLSQAMMRCNSLTDILFGDLELLTSVCKYSCQSDDETNEVKINQTVLTLFHAQRQKCSFLFHKTD